MKRATPFPLPDTDSLPTPLKQEVASRRALHVYRMIMHTPRIAPAFLAMSDALRHETSLPGNLREVAILRVGHRYQAPYEVHHHERLGRSVGLGDAALAATRVGANQEALSPEERLVLSWTDELIDHHALSQASREAALAMLTPTQLADLTLTVGFYQMVCNFLSTFGVEVEGLREAGATT